MKNFIKNNLHIYLFLLMTATSCIDDKKQDEIIYYYRETSYNRENNDTTYSYRAFITKDSINGFKKMNSYRYDSRKNELIPSFSMRVRQEEWGVSKIQGIYEMPLFRIDTHDKIIWDIPEETMFYQSHKFIKKDTLYIKSLKEVMPVYLFHISEGDMYIYLSEDFVWLKTLPDYNSLEPYFIEELIKESEAPKEFRLLMEDVLH